MPLKRSTALQPLSRQHHNGLLFCLLLKKGIRNNTSPRILQDFCMYFRQNDLAGHFRLEEECLAPLPKRFHALQNGIGKMIEEHEEIMKLFAAIGQSPSTEHITKLYHLIESHIRFEERSLFPLLEATLPPGELAVIGKALAHSEEHNCISYPVKFWE